MSKPSIFIGCASGGGEDVAKKIRQKIGRAATVKIWNEGPFALSEGFLESLVKAGDRYDFAVLVVTADDVTTSRGQTRASPRDNVLFELGLFMGRLGRHRTFMVYDKAAAPKLPSDLSGVKFAEYDGASSDLLSALGSACSEIKDCVLRYRTFDVRGPREIPQDGGIVLQQDWGDWSRQVQLRRSDGGLRIRLGNANLSVSHGRIEEVEPADAQAVVLPANEFFDDECIQDKRSALGAFMQSHFGDKIPEITELIKAQLGGGVSGRNYPIGTCVFLDRPLGSPHRLILTAVTTDQEGLRSEIPFVFEALKQVVLTMRKHRLNGLSLPLLGAGHGCLRPEVSLFALVLALSEILTSDGPHVREARIVVFQDAKQQRADLSMPVIERILTTAAGVVS